MSMTLADWDRIIEKMDPDQAQACLVALDELANWDEFKEHFGWTCMFALRPSLRHLGPKRTLRQFKAVDGKDRAIITVLAEDMAEACIEIERQLDREGRRDYYRSWRDGGRNITEEV